MNQWMNDEMKGGWGGNQWMNDEIKGVRWKSMDNDEIKGMGWKSMDE